MRRVKDARIRNIRPKTLREQFQVWERGQIASSAGFLLDFSRGWQIHPGALGRQHSHPRRRATIPTSRHLAHVTLVKTS